MGNLVQSFGQQIIGEGGVFGSLAKSIITESPAFHHHRDIPSSFDLTRCICFKSNLEPLSFVSPLLSYLIRVAGSSSRSLV